MDGFVWYELMTGGDLDAAAAFYGEVVGWEVRDSGMPGMRYLLFGKGGKDVGGMMSWAALGLAMPTAWRGHIHTADVDAETKAVVADGGAEMQAPQGITEVGRFSVVADPQGTPYLLFQPAPTEGAPARLRPMEVGAVGWHELATTDWEKAWEFYSKHYGWTKGEALDRGPMGKYLLIMVSEESGGGMMNLPEAAKAAGATPGWLFYFTVEDIQAAAERVKAKGGKVTHGPMQVPGGAWILQGVDAQGGAFALTAGK